jgi:hypothetical protein
MIETLIALLFAHTLADFVFQTRWMVDNKSKPGVLLAHVAIVLVLSQLAIGRVDSWEILALAASHLVIDAIKIRSKRDDLFAFLLDQAAHITAIIALTIYAPALWADGYWADILPAIPHIMLLITGAILVTRAGGFIVGKLMDLHTAPVEDQDGLPKGGLTIGYLERGLIFVLVLGGQPGSIGFLIAAKSILRFGAVNENRSASEYVIIGTLASFGWALLVALAVTNLQSYLPTLEITLPRP